MDYQNFQAVKPTDTIVPSEIDKEFYMFEPISEKPLGYFSTGDQIPFRIPIWSPSIFDIKKLILKNDFRRNGPFKFVPIAFDLISIPKENIYTPVYALVPESFNLNFGEPPEYIPMLLRTNYTIFDGIRPNLLVNVPVITEKKKEEEVQSPKKIEEVFEKICAQWMLSIVLNRNLQQEAIFKDVKKLIRNESQIAKCKQYFVIPKNQNDQLVIKTSDLNISFPNKICKIKLETILNKPINLQDLEKSKLELTDYVSRDCQQNLNEVINNLNEKTKVLAKDDGPSSNPDLTNIINFN